VFLMIEQHVGIWMWEGPAPGKTRLDYPLLIGFNALGGLAAPLFVTLAGVGSALMVSREPTGVDGTLIRRGLVLMSFGYVLNLLSPSWFSWGSWFVLQMMGFAMALTPLWRRLSNVGLLLLCLAVFAGTVAVQTWLQTPLDLSNDRMRDVSLPGGPLRLALAESQFPILPWLAFFLAGIVAGRFIDDSHIGRVAALGLGFAVFGGVGHFLFLTHRLPLPGPIAARAFGLRLSFFPASVAIVALLLAAALLLIAGMLWLEDRRPFSRTNFWVTLGRSSLTLLMIHVPVFRDLSRLPGIEWWRGFAAPNALGVVFSFFLLAALLTRLWQQVDYRYGAEWALRKLAG